MTIMIRVGWFVSKKKKKIKQFMNFFFIHEMDNQINVLKAMINSSHWPIAASSDRLTTNERLCGVLH